MTSQSPPPAEAAPSAGAAPPADAAARAWAAMQAFVIVQDRRRELREAFEFGRGIGRVTALLTLADGPMTMGELAESQGVDPPTPRSSSTSSKTGVLSGGRRTQKGTGASWLRSPQNSHPASGGRWTEFSPG